MVKLYSSRNVLLSRSFRKPCKVRRCLLRVKRGDTLNYPRNPSEIVKFREMLTMRIERGDPPLLMIPDDHRPVIVKLAHER